MAIAVGSMSLRYFLVAHHIVFFFYFFFLGAQLFDVRGNSPARALSCRFVVSQSQSLARLVL